MKNKRQKTKKQLQIGENIRRLIAREIGEYINIYKQDDFLTIMKADISPDLRYCKVFYRCKICNKNDFQESLNENKNKLSNLIYKYLQMRIRPEIEFIFDDTLIAIEDVKNVLKNL